MSLFSCRVGDDAGGPPQETSDNFQARDFSALLDASLGSDVPGTGASQTQPDIAKILLVMKLPWVL